TATTSPPEPTAAPQPSATSVPSSVAPTGAPGLARGALTQRPIIAMIDNHPDAYPQTGLDHAAVVFEALAEFGVTRFMAVYAPGITSDAARIGPVRSTRLYFAQWAMGFHALYAHAGGSPQGLQLVESTDRALSDFAHPEVGFLFKTDEPASRRPASQQLSYFFIYKEDSAGWNYDPSTNGYLRTRRDHPARDAATGKQLWAKDVVVIE